MKPGRPSVEFLGFVKCRVTVSSILSKSIAVNMGFSCRGSCLVFLNREHPPFVISFSYEF